jgi:hypothetical protein
LLILSEISRSDDLGMCSRCKNNRTNCSRADYLCPKSLPKFQILTQTVKLLLKLLRMLIQGTEDLFPYFRMPDGSRLKIRTNRLVVFHPGNSFMERRETIDDPYFVIAIVRLQHSLLPPFANNARHLVYVMKVIRLGGNPSQPIAIEQYPSTTSDSG